MVDPFAAALVPLFYGPGSVAAIYTAPGGAPVAIRAIRNNGREVQADITFTTEAVQLMRSQVAQPVAGGRIEFPDAAEAFTIQSPPSLDRERLSWDCELQPA